MYDVSKSSKLLSNLVLPESPPVEGVDNRGFPESGSVGFGRLLRATGALGIVLMLAGRAFAVSVVMAMPKPEYGAAFRCASTMSSSSPGSTELFMIDSLTKETDGTLAYPGRCRGKEGEDLGEPFAIVAGMEA